eukprot:11720653-Alexandrium_andersonii.AAC.1
MFNSHWCYSVRSVRFATQSGRHLVYVLSSTSLARSARPRTPPHHRPRLPGPTCYWLVVAATSSL